jgi:hypothetical protein
MRAILNGSIESNWRLSLREEFKRTPSTITIIERPRIFMP